MRVTGIKTGVGSPHNIGHSNAWRDFSVSNSVEYQIKSRSYRITHKDGYKIQYYFELSKCRSEFYYCVYATGERTKIATVKQDLSLQYHFDIKDNFWLNVHEHLLSWLGLRGKDTSKKQDVRHLLVGKPDITAIDLLEERCKERELKNQQFENINQGLIFKFDSYGDFKKYVKELRKRKIKFQVGEDKRTITIL